MKRHDSLIPLSRQHHNALILSQLIRENAPIYKGLPTDINAKREYTLNFFKDHLVPHFEAEELILIPFIIGKDKDLDQLCEQIISEHKKISELVEEIRIGSEVRNNLDKLGNLISLHIRKEEREFFQRIQDVLSENQLLKLRNQLAHLENKKICQ